GRERLLREHGGPPGPRAQLCPPARGLPRRLRGRGPRRPALPRTPPRRPGGRDGLRWPDVARARDLPRRASRAPGSAGLGADARLTISASRSEAPAGRRAFRRVGVNATRLACGTRAPGAEPAAQIAARYGRPDAPATSVAGRRAGLSRGAKFKTLGRATKVRAVERRRRGARRGCRDGDGGARRGGITATRSATS